MKIKSYQQLSIVNLIWQYIRLRGFVECPNLTNDKHIANLDLVKEEIKRRGYAVRETGRQGKMVEFVRA